MKANRVILLVVTFLAGCSKNTLGKEEEDQVRQAVESSLQAWQRGAKAADLRKQAQPIHIVDPDWDEGYRLVGYEIIRLEKFGQNNPRCAVILSLRDADGNDLKPSEVMFEVNLKAKGEILIGRDPFD
jgi:hypothetical protein